FVPEFKGMNPEQAFNIMAQTSIPFQKPQTTEDIGNAVVFLVSDEASEITGQALNVDGGIAFN
ncbi:MAG: SDR family oxidoreductase, partial [Deltaproteobacteria bacterium]|nr:SDR family oxidoreductase [Deltaproteobacteria bacterium]